MQKSVLIVGLAIIAAIVLVMASVGYVLFDIDGLIRKQTEATASRAFKTEASLADASMSLKTGEGRLIGLRIPNPPGFPMGDAVDAPLITAQVDTDVSAGPVMTVAEAVIDHPKVRLDIASGQANLIRLAESARALARQVHDGVDTRGPVQRFRIKQLTLKDGSLTVGADVLKNKTVTVPMPDSRLIDVGGEGGLLPAELVAAVYELIVTASERASRRVDLSKAAEDAGVDKPDIDFAKIFGREAVPALTPALGTAQ